MSEITYCLPLHCLSYKYIGWVRIRRSSLVKKESQVMGTVKQQDEVKQYVLPDNAHEHIGDFYFPINVFLVEDLLGKVLTQIEAMGLRESVEKANKDIARQMIWKWYDAVQENSISSHKGCIAPIELPKTPSQKIK